MAEFKLEEVRIRHQAPTKFGDTWPSAIIVEPDPNGEIGNWDTIAHITGLPTNGRGFVPTTEIEHRQWAFAKLFAASSDLYRAAKLALDWFDSGPSLGGSNRIISPFTVKRELKAAIRKAEGKE